MDTNIEMIKSRLFSLLSVSLKEWRLVFITFFFRHLEIFKIIENLEIVTSMAISHSLPNTIIKGITHEEVILKISLTHTL
jgi:hypothetical protein